MQNRLGYFRFEGTIYIRSHIFNSRNYEKSELAYDAETYRNPGGRLDCKLCKIELL